MTKKRHNQNNHRVLVVEDDPMWAERCIDELAEVGLMAEHATGADTAVELLKSKRYHAVVLDKCISDFSGNEDPDAGIQLLKYIHQNYSGINCLILTGCPSIHSFKMAGDLSVYDYCDKNLIGPRQVAQIVVAMISHPEPERF